MPSPSSISFLLNSCKTLQTLKTIHAKIIRLHLDQRLITISRLLVLCNKLSSLKYSVSIFDRVPRPNLYLYNSILKSHSDHKSPLFQSLSMFNFMRRSRPFGPDGYTFTSMIKSCSNECDVLVGSSFHCLITHHGFCSDLYVNTALIDFYGKCREIDDARRVFDEMGNRKNEVCWTAMLAVYSSLGNVSCARKLFDEMPKRNLVSWNAMIDGYVKVGDMVNARSLFDEMEKKNSVSFTSMINGYAKAGDMPSSRIVFEQGKDCRDVFAWSAIISGYAQNGCPAEALKIFLELYEKNVKPDEHILVGLMSACAQISSLSLAKWVNLYIAQIRVGVKLKSTHVLTALMDMNAKCGNMEGASFLFDSMSHRNLRSYCSMMQGYSLHGFGVKAVETFSRMLKDGVTPDSVAFTVVLNACSHAGLVEDGKHFFELMKNEYLIVPSMDHYACMVDLLGRAGHLKDAYELIQMMPMEPNAGVWGALLGACKLHYDIELGEIAAKRLFEIEPLNPGNYVLLSNMYAAANRWANVSQLRAMMKGRGLRKIPGFTWI